MTRIARVHDRQVPVVTGAGGLGGASPVDLDDLADVDTTGVTDGDILVWDDGTDTWVVGTGDFPGDVVAHGNLGATETLDYAAGTYHWGTLDADCTIGFTGWTNAKDCGITLELIEDGTGGWTPTFTGVTWLGGTTPTHTTTAGTTTVYAFFSRDGGTTIIGGQLGGSGTPASSVESETTFGIAAAVGTDTEYARQDHTHGSPANPVSATALEALGVVGAILISDDHSTPIVFADILLTEAGDDILYADLGG